MPILELKHIRKEFVSGPRTVTALGDVSLRIEEGEMTAVTGPSGAGKSTLLQIMAGLLKPTSGEVKIDGQDLGAMSLSDFTDKVKAEIASKARCAV